MLTAGDTVRVEAGRSAAAVVALTSGEVDAATLAAAGPTRVLDGVVEPPAFLAELGWPVATPARHR